MLSISVWGLVGLIFPNDMTHLAIQAKMHRPMSVNLSIFYINKMKIKISVLYYLYINNMGANAWKLQPFRTSYGFILLEAKQVAGKGIVFSLILKNKNLPVNIFKNFNLAPVEIYES